jgi:hypothetical protein
VTQFVARVIPEVLVVRVFAMFDLFFDPNSHSNNHLVPTVGPHLSAWEATTWTTDRVYMFWLPGVGMMIKD